MGDIPAKTPAPIKGLHPAVDTIYTAHSTLEKRGIEIGEITDCKSMKYTEFRDLDGHSWLV